MTDEEELAVLISLGEELAREMLLVKRHKELVPVYHLIGKENDHHIMYCPWRNDFDKKLHFAAVRTHARKIGCRAFSFVSEGWSVMRPKDNPGGPQPRDDPNRIEIVNISAVNHSGAKTKHLHMVRDLSPGMNNRLIGLELMSEINDARGPMLDGIVQKEV